MPFANPEHMTTAQSNFVAALQRVPLFSDLTKDELMLIAERVSLRQFDSGETIFTEGDLCRELLIIRDGSVKLLKTSANGRQQLLSVERAGNSLAEVSLFDGGPFPATAITVTATTLLSIVAEEFRTLCLRQPAVALKVIKVLGHRLRRMTALVEDLSFSTVRGRLVAHLLHLTEVRGRSTAEATELELTENNEELAARLGTVRELVSRNLGRLHNQGLIHMSRRKVRIPNLAAFKAELERER